ncbi:MAG: AraC family transcriptional regulator [Clostridiales bacterium]|nr:AraC family transcriptional regulator [Clostridiales bacterium]
MPSPLYTTFQEPLRSGVRVAYLTVPGGYNPLHWHDELEILYHLNGASDITIDGKTYPLRSKHMMVIDSHQVHSSYNHERNAMFLRIHISKKYMEKYVPGLEMYRIRCTPDDVNDATFEDYLQICLLLQELVRAYSRDDVTLPMETEGYVLQIFSRIIRCFGYPQRELPTGVDVLTSERIRTVITYVEEHFREPISLLEVSDLLGLGKEAFCRFFKKNMGRTFLQYVNEVRAANAFQDLEETDLPIAEIMERNGFTTQKLFNRTFKEIYGCTPSAARKEVAKKKGER